MEQSKEKSVNGVEITLSEDLMKAFVCFKNLDKEYDRRDIEILLEDIGVLAGMQKDKINAMLAEKTQGKKYVVAEGREPVHGEDGWYEFLFETDIEIKPKILKDGSVDYSEYGEVPTVEEGEKLVIYHPATTEEDGENLFGEIIVAKKGRELAKLKGKGFYVSENGREYFSKTSGRVTYKNDRLLVENELVIDGDVSLSRGNIQFLDDIHIRGNVLTGSKVISERGGIIVDGYVEAADLSAAKDIVLKNGMQGNGKGTIVAGGSVSGKFFEQVNVESGGDVNANAIMNSHITALRDITVSGRFGIIIGGELHAERYITATIIGNMAEVKTRIYAGVEEDLFATLMAKEKEQEALEAEVKKITAAMGQIDILIEKTKREDLREQKVKLIRSKIERENTINETIREKQAIMDKMGRANIATVSVKKTLYPGTWISINGVATRITQETNHAEISARGSLIEVK